MYTETKELIKFLRKQFNPKITKNVLARMEMWDVLTALRGPDDQNFNKKRCTTAVIRKAVFPHNIPAMSRYDTRASADDRRNIYKYGDHFISHTKSAFLALGLNWNTHNPEKSIPASKLRIRKKVKNGKKK